MTGTAIPSLKTQIYDKTPKAKKALSNLICFPYYLVSFSYSLCLFFFFLLNKQEVGLETSKNIKFWLAQFFEF